MPHSTRSPQLTSLFISLALIVCFASAPRAQSALDGFSPNPNGVVYAIVVQPDGRIIVGGEFTSVSPNGGGAVMRNRIARFNPDGTLDAGFDPNANNSVRSIAVQSDGKILVGGEFGNIGGQPRNFIARLDAVTGAADSFDANANNLVYSIAVQPDGKILAGGNFFTIGGQPRNFIARLDAVTGLADSFDPSPTNTVRSIVVQPDGNIIVAGDFTTMGATTRNRLARMNADGTLDMAFAPNADNIVRSIAVQSDGKILAGGNFTAMGAMMRNRIARLDAVTGAADSFDPNADNFVESISVQSDGKILAGGRFASIGGQARNRIARLDAVTGLADSFDPNADNFVLSIAVQPDGKILVGGFFTSVGGTARNYIARIERDGSLDRTLNDLSTDLVFATAIQPDGKIIIGGWFTTVLGVTRNNIARLNTDGTLDAGFNPNANNPVSSIAMQSDGKILAGGSFTNIGGQTRNFIARLDALTGLADSFDPNANFDPNPNGYVGSIAVQSDGKILVGGNFFTIGGTTRNFMARLDPATGLADSFNPNPNTAVFALAVQSDGKILVGGGFNGVNSIGGQTRNRIARLDPATGMADSFNPNADHFVNSIAVQSDGKILAGGQFSNIGGQFRNRIARLDAVTGLADSFDPNATNTVYAIVVQADGKILVGGLFNTSKAGTTIGAQPRNRIARLDAVTGLADSFNPNADGAVTSIAVQSDGKILVGGGFKTIGGQTRSQFARLSNDSAALTTLAVTQTTVTLTRNGSAAQFTRVTFEQSTDNGATYTFLGNGTPNFVGPNSAKTRVLTRPIHGRAQQGPEAPLTSGYTLTGQNLPTGQNILIRARGFYRTGYFNGSETIEDKVQNAYLVPVPTVSGTVTYGNAIGNPAPPRFVRNVSIASTSGTPAVGPVITGTPGMYVLTGFGAGSYTIKPTKPGGSNGAITSNDAARVAQGVVSSPSFVSQNQRFAADVSGNGGVTSNDAALIARFAAGLTGTGNAGQWKFFVTGAPSPLPTAPQTYNDSRTYASVTSSLTGEDYVAILVGEVSGNWNPANHPRPGRVESGKWKVESEDGGPERGVAVELPEMVTPVDKEIVVPVNVQGVADKGVISYEFDLRYDPSVIQPLAEPVDVKGTASRGLMVVANPHEPGLLRVVVYGPMPIDEDGVLLNLKFTAVGAAGSISPLTFERIMFNEGEPDVSIVDGRVELF